MKEKQSPASEGRGAIDPRLRKGNNSPQDRIEDAEGEEKRF
jgi:hypothetical protein